MNQKNFTNWYYRLGLQQMIAIGKRISIFIPRFFAFTLLTQTLFSPWHRDVSLKNWRGFNPLRSFERISWNIFSRIIGACVRSCVLITGVILWVVLFFGSIIGIVVYVFAPVILLVLPFLFMSSFMVYVIGFFVVTLGIVALAYHTYRVGGHLSYKLMDMHTLHQQAWFYRVYERIGVAQSDIPYDILGDFHAFEQYLVKHDVTVKEFESIIAWEIEKQKEREEAQLFFSEIKMRNIRPFGLNWHFGYTVHLDRYVEDLVVYDRSEYANSPFSGYEQEMKMLEIVLSRPQENNVIITGQAGIGRHMIVHELARRIRTGYYDGTFMQHMRILQCDFTSVIAQAKSIGDDPEFVIHNLFHEAAYAGNVIFVIDNFDQYMHTDTNRGFSFITIIDEYASLPSFCMIGITTEDAFHETVDAHHVTMRHFDIIPIHEMDEECAMKILFAKFYGKEHTPFTYQALRQVIADAERYVNTAPLPMRAISLATEVLLYWQNHSSGFITAQTVDAFINEKTGIPVGNIDTEEQEKLLSLEDLFHQRIVGQDGAVQAVASSVRRMRSGMVRPNKPAGSFLFLGPTGVGKTEMAKTVSQQYFGSSEKVVRIDMSEYQGVNAVDRLIGSKELNQQGAFVSAVREHPYAVLLLDEIEKANPLVLDLFLQVLDEGFLHDAFGRKVSFTSMIIIATSNAGSLIIKKMIEMGINPKDAEKKVIDAVIEGGFFRAEFINRFDDVVIFEPLRGEMVQSVAVMLLEQFAHRVGEEQHITLAFDPEVANHIIEKGYNPIFGARSLAHFIDDAISDALAKKLIMGNIHRGETVRFGIADMDSVQ